MLHDLIEFFEPSLRDDADKTAIVTPDGEQITYRRLGAILDAYGARASSAGISRGNAVTLHDVSMTQYLCLVIALSRLGAVHVRAPDPDGGAARVDCVIVDKASGLSGPNVVRMDLSWPYPGEPLAGARGGGFASQDDVCIIMGTSGSTGLPKQLGISLGLMAVQMKDAHTNLGPFNPRLLLVIPPTLSFGLELCLLQFRAGQQIVLPGRTHQHALAQMIDGQVDDVIASPAVYSAWIELLKRENLRLDTVKRAIIGGSIASRALLASVQEYICKVLISAYGSSEVGAIAAGRVDEFVSVDDAVGRLSPWVDVRITDDQGHELPNGRMGQLSFRLKLGRRLTPYIGEPPLGADDWFVSGDIGTLTPDGFLCIQGRTNEVMNVGGNKISPTLVETAVSEFLGTTEPVCAFGMPGSAGFDEVVIIVSAQCSARLKELPDYLEQADLGLGRVHILAIRTFPLNEFGKVDKIKLREMVGAEIARRRMQSRGG